MSRSTTEDQAARPGDPEQAARPAAPQTLAVPVVEALADHAPRPDQDVAAPALALIHI